MLCSNCGVSEATTGEGLCNGCVVPLGISAPAPPMPPAVAGKPAWLRSPVGLSRAVSVLLGLVIVVDVFSIYTEVTLHRLMGYVLVENFDAFTDQDAARADTQFLVGVGLQLATLLATAVVFLVWFYRVRVNAEVFEPEGHARRRGWTIGSWFVPVVHLWFPRRIAVDIWKASTQRTPDGSVVNGSHAVLNAWWTVFVISVLVDRGASKMYERAEEPEEIQEAASMLMVSDVTDIIAAVLAILFVRRLTAMQNAKALQGAVALAD